jgi:hypothetical protein
MLTPAIGTAEQMFGSELTVSPRAAP